MSRYIDANLISYEHRDRLGLGIDYGTTDKSTYEIAYKSQIDKIPTADVEEVRHGKWEVRHRHEHYPSGKPYEENICPFCKRADHNGDGLYCGYCGAKMDKE